MFRAYRTNRPARSWVKLAVAPRVDRGAFAADLDGIRKIAPKPILNNHLPPDPGHLMEWFLGSLAAAPGAHPFVGPNQAALDQMLKQMAYFNSSKTTWTFCSSLTGVGVA